MCRNSDHGGRRCPNDNSAARRIRRTNRSLRMAFEGNLHKPIHTSDVNQENLSPQAIQSEVTIQDIKLFLQEYNQLKNIMWDSNGKLKPFEGELILDGVQYGSQVEFSTALRQKIEQETIKLGGLVALKAAQETGFTDELIIESNRKQVDEAEAAYKSAIQEYEQYAEQMKNKYSTSVMDIAYNIKSKMESEEQRILEDTLYTPAFPIDEMQSDYETAIELRDKKDAAYQLVRNVKHKGTEEATKMLATNREKQLEILKQLRPFGGDAVVHPKSNKVKVKVLNEALGFIPSEWVERSNQTGEDLMVKATKARAHYTDGSYQKEYKVTKSGRLKVLRNGEEPKNTRHESGWVRVEADENGLVEYLDESGRKYETYIEPGEVAYYAPDWEYARAYYDYQTLDPNKKPYGRGWELATILDSDYNPETKEHIYTDKQVWRRRVTRREMVSVTRTAELLIDGDGKYRNGLDTAVHEFMHRVEARDPRLGQLEAEFVKRRTTLSDGTQEKPVRIYAGKNEFARPDNFIDNYMGKHYDHSNGTHWELVSTGAEALWQGRFGGFMGIGNVKPDTEHRDFMLGIFAGL